MGQTGKKFLKMNIIDILTTSKDAAFIKTRPSIFALTALAVDKKTDKPISKCPDKLPEERRRKT